MAATLSFADQQPNVGVKWSGDMKHASNLVNGKEEEKLKMHSLE